MNRICTTIGYVCFYDCLGIYWIQNLITAVVYRAFRGYFLNSIINSQLRRRLAVRASYEVLRRGLNNEGSIEIRYESLFSEKSSSWIHSSRQSVPISIVKKIVNASSMSQWHCHRINQVSIDSFHQKNFERCCCCCTSFRD